jgi:membrane-bound lytic murein transglycosylase B
MRSLLAAVLLASSLPALAQAYDERAEVRAFIEQLVERHGFVESELKLLFARVQRVEPVLQSILPAERPSWDEYRAQFVNAQRVSRGLAFWKANRAALARAERRYGVPAPYVVAIIGVETNYGRNMGRWRVVDALATLAFDYAPRAPYFRSELEQFLLLARDGGVDVFSLRGSYAGAIGIPQFMPGSLRRYGVDFDGDGAIDLRGSPSDAIGSVANFLEQHGWRAGEPAVLRAKSVPPEARAFADGSIEPRHRLAALAAAGIETEPAPPAPDALGALVLLGGEDYRVGLQNFYVITRYNRSALYAGAVCDLARALAEGVQSAGK